ncbi:hypothetical protein GCM10023322_13970 [Rugosimonospora acidiphila]|uniref:DUF5709 domain-containing protein n=1 Tax=Rugosimonospora acidiphila TaxID=556531 RepID=A0ABP9RM08_9ACTN
MGDEQPRRPYRSDEDELDGRDFAEEHDDLTHADSLRGGPERAVDEAVPSGLAGQDPNDASR